MGEKSLLNQTLKIPGLVDFGSVKFRKVKNDLD
jgi:hypothetical protein